MRRKEQGRPKRSNEAQANAATRLILSACLGIRSDSSRFKSQTRLRSWDFFSARFYWAPPGGFLVALQDIDDDGQADVTAPFGDSIEQGNHGGTGIALYEGALYAESNDRIVRYALSEDGIVPQGAPETIVSGLPLTGDRDDDESIAIIHRARAQ
jgi:hypothetical protein